MEFSVINATALLAVDTARILWQQSILQVTKQRKLDFCLRDCTSVFPEKYHNKVCDDSYTKQKSFVS